MKIETKLLRAAFDQIAHLAAKRSSLPILSTARFHSAAGQLTITTSDTTCFARVTLPTEGDLPATCVSAAAIASLLKNAKDHIAFTRSDTKLTLESNGTASLGLWDADEFPAFPADKTTALGINPTDLADAIESVAWAAGKNPSDSSGMTEAIYVKTAPKSITCAATDKTRFAYTNRPLIAAEAEFLFPSDYSPLLCDALRAPGAQLSLSDNWLACQSDTLSVALRRKEGRYWNLAALLEAESEPIGTLSTAPILEALGTVLGLSATETFAPVALQFGDTLHLQYTGKTSGSEYSTDIPAEKKLTGRPVKCDAKKLHHLLSHAASTVQARITSNALILQYGDTTSALALLSEK